MQNLKGIWYFIIPTGIVLSVSLFSFATILVAEWPLQFCFSTNCWSNLLFYFSFTFQSLAAGIVLVTLSFTAFRIQQTKQQLDIQEKQIVQSQYYQFRNEFNDFFSKYEDEHYFNHTYFRFKDKFLLLFPNAHLGNRELSDEFHSWLSKSVVQHIANFNDGVRANELQAYFIKSYAQHFNPIFNNYRKILHINIQIDSELFGAIVPGQINQLVSDIDPRSRNQYGNILWQIFSDALFVAKAIDSFLGNKYFSLDHIRDMDHSLAHFKKLVESSMKLHADYENGIQQIGQIAKLKYAQENGLLNLFTRKSKIEKEILQYKLESEKRIAFSMELREHLNTR